MDNTIWYLNIVAAVESLGKANRATWQSCVKRDFNIGYDCGDEPWEFNQGLSAKLLGRLAGLLDHAKPECRQVHHYYPQLRT